MHIAALLNSFNNELLNTTYSGFARISDIIDAIYGETGVVIHNKKVELFCGHGANYYLSHLFSTSTRFHEIIANYVTLRLNQDYESIQLLEEYIGEDFVLELEDVFIQLLS